VSAIGFIGENLSGGSGSISMPIPGGKVASRFQNLLGCDVTVTVLNGEWDSSTSGIHVKGFAYTDNAGSPDALVAVTNERTTIVGLTPFTFTTPWVWPNNAWRWLGIVSPEGYSSASQRNTTGKTVNYNTDPYTGSLPANPFGTPSTVAPWEYRFWVEVRDSQLRFGRISTQNMAGTTGVYWNYNPHFDRFVLDEVVNVNVTSMSAFVTTTSSGAKGHCGIYKDDGSFGPGTLVAQSNDTTGFTANTWANFTFPATVTLTPGTYWLAIIFDTDINTPIINNNGHLISSIGTGGDPAWFPFPSPMPSSGYGNLGDKAPIGISLYASYDLITAVDPATQLVPQPQPVMPGRPIHVRPY
jgi:hypothetical protein